MPVFHFLPQGLCTCLCAHLEHSFATLLYLNAFSSVKAFPDRSSLQPDLHFTPCRGGGGFKALITTSKYFIISGVFTQCLILLLNYKL